MDNRILKVKMKVRFEIIFQASSESSSRIDELLKLRDSLTSEKDALSTEKDKLTSANEELTKSLGDIKDKLASSNKVRSFYLFRFSRLTRTTVIDFSSLYEQCIAMETFEVTDYD